MGISGLHSPLESQAGWVWVVQLTQVRHGRGNAGMQDSHGGFPGLQVSPPGTEGLRSQSQPCASFGTRRVSCHTPWFGTCCVSLLASPISENALPSAVGAIGLRG